MEPCKIKKIFLTHWASNTSLVFPGFFSQFVRLLFKQRVCLGDVLPELLLAGVTFVRLWAGEANTDTSLIPLAIQCKSSQVCIMKPEMILSHSGVCISFFFGMIPLWITRVFVGNVVKIGSNSYWKLSELLFVFACIVYWFYAVLIEKL